MVDDEARARASARSIMEHAEGGIRGPPQRAPEPSPWALGALPQAPGPQGKVEEAAKSVHAKSASRNSINMLDEDEGEEELFTTSEEVEVEVAADSGAVAHTTSPKGLPGTVKAVRNRVRNFVGAGGEGIAHHGTARVRLQQEDGRFIQNDFEVADVCRPLHSVSTICDNEHDFLFTKKCGYVVPEGVFEEILAKLYDAGRIICRYPRRGGLYVATMKATDPTNRSKVGNTAPFAGQDAGQ